MAAVSSLSRKTTIDPAVGTDGANLNSTIYSSMAGGLTDFVLYRDIYSSGPRTSVTTTQTTSGRLQHVLLIGKPFAGVSLAAARIFVASPPSSGSSNLRAYLYQGADLSALPQVAISNVFTTTNGDNPTVFNLTFPSAYTTTDGFLAVVINTSSPITLGAMPITGGTNFVNSSYFTSGYANTSAAPASTINLLNINGSGVYTGASTRPWCAFSTS